MQGSLLASFGFRTLSVLRAVKAGTPLISATQDRLAAFGLATIDPDGTTSLTISGLELLAYLESLELVPEEHVEFVEAVSGPASSKKPSSP
jgi:hypothetical protein